MKARNLHHLNNKTILLFTEVVDGSGDFFAAKKFIRQLNHDVVNIRIYWYVSAPNLRVDVKDKVAAAMHELGDNVTITLLKVRAKINTDNCKRCDLVLLFPTVHRLSLIDFDVLRAYKVPVIQVHEYDNYHNNHHMAFKSELLVVDTGFNGLGLYLENLEQRALPKPPQYNPERVTLFSYLNLDSDSVVNEANIQHYLQIALTIIDADKSVDLITNSSFTALDSDFLSFIWSHGFSEIKVISKDKHGVYHEQLRRTPRHDTTPKQLQFINSFPMSNDEMLGAMSIAHPFIQVTGDQSLSEVMSLSSFNKGVFPFYQIMEWKNILYQHWLEVATACLGAESPYLSLLKQLEKGKPLNIFQFAETWRTREVEILANSLHLSALIKKERNLIYNYPMFLDHLFYVIENFPDADFSQYCQLAVQLIAKLGDMQSVRDCLDAMSQITDAVKRRKHMLALSEFLTMNAANVTPRILSELSQHLLTLKDDDHLPAAITLRKILAILPAESRDKYIVRMLTDLTKVSSACYHLILKEIQEFKHFDVIDNDTNWFSCLVAKNARWVNPQLNLSIKNKILLAVNVFPDGVGDISKFIGVYHLLRRQLPTTKITCLVHCFDASRQTLLAMLRENGLPLLDTFICSFTEIEHLLGMGSENTAIKKYAEVNFDHNGHYALYVSVATPFSIINQKFRQNLRATTPYLEIAEVDYVSYCGPYSRDLRQPHDTNHHLAAMGLDETAVGIEITETVERSVADILESLSPALTRQLLDGDTSLMALEQFMTNTFFMPAYVKGDQGYLSLYYMLTLCRTAYTDKTNAVIWMHDLPCDLRSCNLQDKLRESGFSQVTHYNAEGNRTETQVESPLKRRQLRIITGRIESKDFDLLYQLASKMGGFAGCAGQNSFEKSISFSLVPAFCAPSWQLAIISQTRSQVANVFPHQSANYHILDDYLSMLSNVSMLIVKINKLFSTSKIKPYVHQFQHLRHIDLIKKLMDIYPDVQTLIQECHPDIYEADPLEMIEHFFITHDIELLQNAWRELCAYIKQHKNLNSWITRKIHELIPDAPQLMPVNEMDVYVASAHVLASNAYAYVTPETLPHTHELIQKLLGEICTPRKAALLQFIISDASSLLIENVAGLLQPTIAISTLALRTLSLLELRFGLRLCLGVSDIYAIENPALYITNLSQEELVNQIKGDLGVGVSYCRKLIDVLSGERRIFKNFIYRPKSYYDLGDQKKFYRDMIKVIELRLAAAHKHELQSSLFKPPRVRIPESVTQEIMHLQTSISVIPGVVKQQPSTLQQLTTMLEVMPQLRIRNIAEYSLPTLLSRRFLTQFEEVKIDPYDQDQVKAVHALIDSAYENRAALFTKLYLAACRKLYRDSQIAPLGPYHKLLDLLKAFIASNKIEMAEMYALAIEECLHSRAYLGMFYTSAEKEEGIFILNGEDHAPDSMLCSSVGCRIHWLDFLATPDFSHRISTLQAWAVSASSTPIAKILFRLGYVANKQLWDFLPHEFIKYMHHNAGMILGTLPEEYAKRSNQDSHILKAGLIDGFIKQYLIYRYKRDYHPAKFPATIENIEAFIKSNKNILSIPELDASVTQQLTELFDAFLLRDPNTAQQYIYRFYCDKTYADGIYGLLAHREKIAVGMVNQVFDGNGLRKYRSESSAEALNGHLAFILKHCPDYIPVADLLDSLESNFYIPEATWPIEYFFRVLKLRIDVLKDVVAAVNSISSFEPLLRTLSANRFLSDARINACKYAAERVPDIKIFSPVFYEYMQTAEKYRATIAVCDLLWKRAGFREQVMQLNTPVNISAFAIAHIYCIFDFKVSWPDTEVRDRLSAIMLTAIQESDTKERETTSAALLFRTFPIADRFCIQELIKIWVAIQASKYGIDDNSYLFFQKLSILVMKINNTCPAFYVKDILELLSVSIQAQDKLSEFIDQLLNPGADNTNNLRLNKDDMLVMTAKVFAKEKLSMDFVKFLSYELTQTSLKAVVARTSGVARQALTRNDIYLRNVDDKQAEILIIFFYHNFWELDIEERAVIINNLLIPSTSVSTQIDANRAYEAAFNYIINQLFPDKNDENNLCIALLESYLKASNDHVRPYLLAAILTANRMIAGKQRSIATTLPKIAEALGAAGVKAGQVAHSFPNTPLHFRVALAYLKSQARLPYHWELWKLMKKAVPLAMLPDIKRMQSLLGGASFYLAVEVVMTNGDVRVLRLLRENAKHEAKYGFAHLKATLDLCHHDNIQGISADLVTIILEAEKGAQIEINSECARRQYELANVIYQDKRPVKVTVKNANYYIKIIPVKLYEAGDGYQLIDKAHGIEFNDLKKLPEQEALCQAVATVVYQTELENMLSGKPCDMDRHGAQARITSEEVAPGEFVVTVVNYDFGEIAPDLPTPAQLEHCQNFINELARTLFSSANLLRFMFGGLDHTTLTDQLTKQMLAYMRLHDNADQDNNDLSRLRGMFKGLLALNDYFEVIPKTRSFLLELNALFLQYAESPSYVSSVLGLFSRKVKRAAEEHYAENSTGHGK